MKKSLLTLAGLSCLSTSLLAPVVASAYTPVNPQDLPPLVLDPLDNQVMTTSPLPPQSYTGFTRYEDRPYATPIQPLPLTQIKPGPPKADPSDTSNGYQPLAPIVVAPEDSQVMTTVPLPPAVSQPRPAMANGYTPLDPIVVAPEDSQVMTTTPLPPKESQPMENGYQTLPPIVVAPEDSQVMTTVPLPPKESEACPYDGYTDDATNAAGNTDYYDYSDSYDYSDGYTTDASQYDGYHDDANDHYDYDQSYQYGYDYNYDYNYDYSYGYNHYNGYYGY